MTYHLSSPQLSLTVSSVGAEIVSLQRSDGSPVIWDANPEYWNRHAPLLFPCVGGNFGGLIRVSSQVYPLPKHGFVQDTEFQLTEQTDHSLRLSTTSNARTLSLYPFSFRLHVVYTLSQSTLRVEWIVENSASSAMTFMIGAHPAFMLPGFEANSPLHGYLRFPEIDSLMSTPTLPHGFTHPARPAETFALSDHLLPLTNETFLCDTILDTRGIVSEVELLNAHRRPLLRMKFQVPVLALWAPCGGRAPFVCIEPWCGLCDSEGFSGQWQNRPFAITIPAHESWRNAYEIIVMT